ncbi:MAG: hypothetical protein ACU836_17230 [Gammaproteobacteria bacterium]
MKNFRKVIVSLVMTATLAVSSLASAGEDSQAKVREAGEGALAKVEEAVNMQAQGVDKENVIAALKDARQLQKEFRFEGTERLRQKAGDTLRVARKQIEDGDTEAAATLQELLAMYQEMMKMYNAAH